MDFVADPKPYEGFTEERKLHKSATPASKMMTSPEIETLLQKDEASMNKQELENMLDLLNESETPERRDHLKPEEMINVRNFNQNETYSDESDF